MGYTKPNFYSRNYCSFLLKEMNQEESAEAGPSDEGKAAVINAISIIEGCNPQDRGYVLNRLSQIYFGAKGAKQIRGALKSSKATKKSTKVSWKKEWEAHKSYKDWQAHILAHKSDTPQQREATGGAYETLRQEAFRVRDSIKATARDRGGGSNNEGERA